MNGFYKYSGGMISHWYTVISAGAQRVKSELIKINDVRILVGTCISYGPLSNFTKASRFFTVF